MKKLNFVILSFGLIKLILHFFTNTNYGLHRDEYLYFAEGQHLAWGFMEVPPFTPFLAAMAGWMGGSVFMIRFFPALVGTVTIIIAGWLVNKLGGQFWSILITCAALTFSPALLGSNTLFQPVTFNQFFWFLSATFLVLAIKSTKPKYWYLLGVSMGLGFLTKYSIVFYGLGIVLGILVTRERKWLATKYPYLALLIAMIIAAPNLLWQWQHHFPIIAHMQELSENQLVNINWFDYVIPLFLFHISFSIVWLAGLIALFKMTDFKPYRFAGFGFIFTVLIIGLLSGKSYYNIGAFTILIPFGGIAIERVIKNHFVKSLLLSFMILITIPTTPYVLPILKIDKMRAYCAFMAEHIGFKNQLRWEDGKYHELPQDYADMHGWEELSQKVARVYHQLPDSVRKHTMIWGGSYGHAGSLNYFKEKYNLPEAYSLNSSFMNWIPDKLSFKYQILIEEEKVGSSSWFHDMILMDSIENPYARDRGFIYFRKNPKIDIEAEWIRVIAEEKKEFGF